MAFRGGPAVPGGKMCGIVGYLTRETNPQFHPQDVIRKMTDAIVHRGPDDEGQWWDGDAGIGLGMRRLAIIDLSPAGRQPMISACGRYALVFNGEIYNHKAIRAELEAAGLAPVWRGHSDTEVLLAAISVFGLSAALQRSNGMFAIALWDRQERTLELAIDRFGEKPLYHGWARNNFLFGSELKSLRVHPAWVGDIDRDVLTLFMRYIYIPAPFCIYKSFQKVEPGQIVRIRNSQSRCEYDRYWSTSSMVQQCLKSPLDVSKSEAVEAFEHLLSDAVGLRMEADVPLGAFLSGGFDSTAVVAMMQRQSSRPVRTFTIGFTERKYDEAPYARAVAQHLGTNHTELYVAPREAMNVIPRLPMLYDEPFADSSQIPTFLVSQLAGQHVTVALSGDAGDELFGGYRRYFISQLLLPSLTRIPHGLRRMVAWAVEGVGSHRWDMLYQMLSFGTGKMLVGDRALKLANLLDSDTPLEGYCRLISAWNREATIVLSAQERDLTFDDPVLTQIGFVEQMMFLDLMSYLPGDILTKVDRASMGVSLEARVPFLDHRVAEFAWRLPISHKVCNGVGKQIIRKLVYRYVPSSLMDRPKTGFSIPIEEWLRRPLRDWAQSLLAPERIRASGYFDSDVVTRMWTEHLSGRRNWQTRLWSVLMFEAWLQSGHG